MEQINQQLEWVAFLHCSLVRWKNTKKNYNVSCITMRIFTQIRWTKEWQSDWLNSFLFRCYHCCCFKCAFRTIVHCVLFLFIYSFIHSCCAKRKAQDGRSHAINSWVTCVKFCNEYTNTYTVVATCKSRRFLHDANLPYKETVNYVHSVQHIDAYHFVTQKL